MTKLLFLIQAVILARKPGEGEVLFYRMADILKKTAWLFWAFDSASIVQVNTRHKSVVYLLLIVFPLSLWAGGPKPCSQEHDTQAEQTQAAAAHAHHGAAPTVQDAGAAGIEETKLKSPPGKRSCCDECIEACVLAGCSLLALSSELRPAFLSNRSDPALYSALSLSAPTCPSLYRPPILPV
ncbi:MAG: hypothetical protein SH820_09695 [Xanthomonadales bacterium]|nr:hypothetical protein [Xanthomonadales bacterium]